MKRILVVDDDPTARYSVSRLLASVGFDVASAPDFLSALQELDRSECKLLITDVVMPKGVNGFALARMAQMRQRDLKVMFMTGYDVQTDEATGTVLRKPFTDRTLLDNVEAMLAA